MSWLTTTSAAAKTASVAALSPASQSKMWLSGLARQVVADDRGAGVERPLGVDHHRQRLVLDVDQLQRVPGRVPVLGHDERDLLALEAHLVGGQDRLRVLGDGGHPGQPERGQVLPGDHGLDPGVGLGRRGVDRDDPGVRERAAQDRAVQHAGQLDVVHERAPAADEAGILLARDRPVRPVRFRVRSSGPPGFRTMAAVTAARPGARLPTAPTARCSRSPCTGRPGRTAPPGSAPATGPGCGRAASGRSASCPACRTRTAARGTGRSPPGPGRAARPVPGPPP